jgi:hypothetical protein
VPDYSGLFHACWADEDPQCDAKFEYDRYDFVRDLLTFQKLMSHYLALPRQI